MKAPAVCGSAPRPGRHGSVRARVLAERTITRRLCMARLDVFRRAMAKLYLASDALRGRDTPSPGLDSAGCLIAREFAA